MALGVLNNLSAIYAQNNLNNTSNSLQTVLQQLSSGSKINSGADDAAGLSLVNGLAANSAALTQSATNATEGVGLLNVADGSLSQVTSLLDRAITLATEASNGTLNATQDAAANQEYQSILSEINNIGVTTTYNQQQVFSGNTVAIYTGDSSSVGSSIDNLNIRTLSQSSIGDTGGQMIYSNGLNNVFLDLSSGGKDAGISDSLNANGTTTITVNYMAKGANGSSTLETSNITVGTGTQYTNTAQGLISAVNNSGLGISASFGTASSAGTAATATATSANDTNSTLLTGSSDTGIILSGTGVAVNNNSPATGYSNGVGEIGTLTVSQSTDTLGGTLNVTDSSGTSHTITLGTTNSTDTLVSLASTINSAGYGITATVNAASVTNASGTHAAGTVLTFISSSSSATIGTTTATDQMNSTAVGGSWATGAGAGNTIGVINVANSTDVLSGVLALTQDKAAPVTTNLLLGTSGSTDTLTNLATTINASNGVGAAYANIQATVTNGGKTLTLTEKNAVISGGPVAAVATGSQIQDNATTSAGTVATVAQNAALLAGTAAGTTFGTISVTNANDSLTGGSIHISDVVSTGGTTINLGTAGTTDNLSDLAAYINTTLDGGTAASHISATVSTDGTQLVLKNTTVAAGSANDMLYGTSAIDTLALTGTPTASGSASATTMGMLSLAAGSTSATPLTGSLTLGTETILLGSAAGPTTPGTATMTELAQTINSGSYGVTATLTHNGTAMVLTSPDSTNTSITPIIAGDPTLSWGTQNAGSISSSYYSVGISGTVTDTSTGGGTGVVGMSSDNNGTGGIATISYTDGSGESLSSTDLEDQSSAQSALTQLNQAITDVAAQDGYIGAQINTLNSISQVMSTQQENLLSAQNAVQATDYASATSNMSKYEILSQTGIAALAQANTTQQEVTKLLQ